MKEEFIQKITAAYQPKGAFVQLGSGILEEEIVTEAQVKLSLKMMNRHGLIAGATGTGKTRTLQLIAEQLSDAGVPVFMLDIKGDLSGLAEQGESNAALIERGEAVGVPFQPASFPIELFSLSGELGTPMRVTVEDFGPILLARILDLNDTQSGVLGALFKFAQDQKIPIVDLQDLKRLLSYLSDGSGAAKIKEDYGKISTASAQTILRKIVSVEQQGLTHIFGEREFEIDDLLGKMEDKGVISLLNISDIQDQPLLFSTFLLSLLNQLFKKLPEVGDLDQPKLVFFFDEAHLLFKGATKAFLSQIEQIVRLIRSKGVGVFFCTQAPTDIPESVLGQLGNRVQHALRAFTPNDAEDLRQAVKTYPTSAFYQLEKTLTSLGTGQALITVLNDKGVPTEVVATHLVAARAVMGPCSPGQYEEIVKSSALQKKYAERVERRSATEIIEEMERKEDEAKQQERVQKEVEDAKKKSSNSRSRRQTPMEAAETQASRTLAREGAKLLGKIANGILSSLFKKK